MINPFSNDKKNSKIAFVKPYKRKRIFAADEKAYEDEKIRTIKQIYIDGKSNRHLHKTLFFRIFSKIFADFFFLDIEQRRDLSTLYNPDAGRSKKALTSAPFSDFGV